VADNGKCPAILWVILLILLVAALWGWLRPTAEPAIVSAEPAIVGVDLVNCEAGWVDREAVIVALDCAVTLEDEDGNKTSYPQRGHDTTEVVGPGDEGQGD
jgi:hypothetical protein